jgi:hypothetical protein
MNIRTNLLFAVVFSAGIVGAGTVGCELIASVDRTLIQDDAGASGGGGGSGSNTTSSAGGGGATGGGGNGGGGTTSCTTPVDCPDPGTECVERTCENNVCGTTNVANNTPLSDPAQTPGDCKQRQCDGDGGEKEVDLDADFLDDNKECTDDACDAGNPTHEPKIPGTICTQGGGAVCKANGDCVGCIGDGDCATPPNTSCNLTSNTCVPPQCANGAIDPGETDTDCGGPLCPKCGPTKMCLLDTDCVGNDCSDANSTCVPNCSDLVQNNGESDTDCGGPNCNPCGPGGSCDDGGDCTSSVCSGTPMVCQIASCGDDTQNQLETDEDCGGPNCGPCPNGDSCLVPEDCQSEVCTGNECQVPSCTDGVTNGSESDLDCGGACPGCYVGKACNGDTDCGSGGVTGSCTGNLCVAAPHCTDMMLNGGETAEDAAANGDDCGGNECAPCVAGSACNDDLDCVSASCNVGSGVCD